MNTRCRLRYAMYSKQVYDILCQLTRPCDFQVRFDNNLISKYNIMRMRRSNGILYYVTTFDTHSSPSVLDNINSIGNNSPSFTGVVYTLFNRGARDRFRVSADGYHCRRAPSRATDPVSSFTRRGLGGNAVLTSIEMRSARNFTFSSH